MVVVVASYYRLGLINIALRYTCFWTHWNIYVWARGSLSSFLSDSCSFSLLSLSLFLALKLYLFRSLSLCASVATLPIFLSFVSFLASDTRDQLANHFLLCNPASTRSAFGLLTLFCSSASALLVLFCFFRFVQSSSPARESLAATRLPLEAAIQKKKIHFCVVRRHVRQRSTSTL